MIRAEIGSLIIMKKPYQLLFWTECENKWRHNVNFTTNDVCVIISVERVHRTTLYPLFRVALLHGGKIIYADATRDDNVWKVIG